MTTYLPNTPTNTTNSKSFQFNKKDGGLALPLVVFTAIITLIAENSLVIQEFLAGCGVSEFTIGMVVVLISYLSKVFIQDNSKGI